MHPGHVVCDSVRLFVVTLQGLSAAGPLFFFSCSARRDVLTANNCDFRHLAVLGRLFTRRFRTFYSRVTASHWRHRRLTVYDARSSAIADMPPDACTPEAATQLKK